MQQLLTTTNTTKDTDTSRLSLCMWFEHTTKHKHIADIMVGIFVCATKGEIMEDVLTVPEPPQAQDQEIKALTGRDPGDEDDALEHLVRYN